MILNWNGRPFLEQFLPSVCASDYPNLVVYVADNASTDDSVAWLRTAYPDVRLILLPANNGYAGGYREALEKVDAEYYVLLNQDVEVDPGWIRPVIQLMYARPAVAACQPKIRSYHQRDGFEYAGAAGGWLDRYGFAFCRGRLFDTIEKDRGQYDQPAQVSWASGAALFVRAAAYREAGGLDADFFAHMEEIDLCWRLQRLGYEIWCCPASLVYHVGGGSLPRGHARKLYLNFRNNLMMLHKNLAGRERRHTVTCRLLLDGIAGLRSLVTGHPRELWMILKAHRHFHQWRKRWAGDALPERSWKSLRGFYRGSLVWQYFVRGRRRFADLPIGDARSGD